MVAPVKKAFASIVRLIIIGPPGSGKGTVSQRIVTDFGLKYWSCGDVLRKHIREDTDFGKEAQKYVEKGNLIPDALVTELSLNELAQFVGKSCLIDGFPRTVVQAQSLLRIIPIDAVIDLDVPFEVIVDRLSKRWIHAPSGRIYNLDFNPPKVQGQDDHTGEPLTQRSDDSEGTVRNRLESYAKWEQPVAQFFQSQNLLKRFSGSTTNELWPSVFDFLATKIKPLQRTPYNGNNNRNNA